MTYKVFLFPTFNLMLSATDFEYELYVYRVIMHINGISSFLSTLLAIYVIIVHSAPQMAQYRWYLLNIVAWSSTLDIYLGILYSPVLLFPATGLCVEGLFATFNNLSFIQFQFVSIFYKNNNPLRYFSFGSLVVSEWQSLRLSSIV